MNKANKAAMKTRTGEKPVHSMAWRFLLSVLLMLSGLAFAQGSDSGAGKFNHDATGFFLTGAHKQVPCESCHVQGVFKGTPKDCATCHSTGNRMGATVKPPTHIPTDVQCDSCHKTTVWTNARFSHVSLAPGSCLVCHNGTTASGKPNGHVPANGSCDNCHKTIGWQQAVFSHAGIISGCASCHNGQSFNGVTPVTKPSNHMVTSAPCESCHTSTITFKSSAATVLPANHLPTTQSCGICHNVSGFIPGVMNHTGILNGCSNCHNGQNFLGVKPVSKPANHVPTTAACETCHSTGNFVSFSGTAMNHSGITSNCTQCHNGQVFAGVSPVFKPANHLPTTSACETCHSSSQFTTFSGTAMNHTGITSNCTQCHNGQVFAGVTPVSKSSYPSHVVTTQDCSACHTSTVTFASGTGGTTMPPNHVPTSQPCSTCHTSFGVNSGVMNHVGIVNGCATCHNGQVFYGVAPVSKPANHLPTTAACETCHAATKFTSFSGTSMKHTGITGNCTQCHNGQVFAGVTPVSKPANHLPTTAACETCHAATTFTSFSGTAMNHSGILSGCALCHNGQAFAGVTPVSKPVNHLPTTQACETCHAASKFTSFSGATMIHTGIVSGCATCHNGQVFAGVTPVSKPVNHLPTSLACETCHSPTKFTSFSGTSMNHTGITSNCTLCHNGQSFAGVTPVSKPSNHIPYAGNLTGGSGMGCEFCHKPTVFTSFTALVGTRAMHNGTLGNGSGWCKACHLKGTSWLGSMTRNTLNHDGTGTDCSQSGCHKPTGNTGTAYTTWTN